MNEIKELLEQAKQDGITNPDSLDKLYQALILLIARVEDLENTL